ncbi:hypothetical protein TNCV_1667841 [Trichonephila clavipes]|nr:hypothetical protein TNCV_1667841 [Trichonephila clavipes]
MCSWGTEDQAASTSCQSGSGVEEGGVIWVTIFAQPWTTCFLSPKDPESDPAREANQSGERRRSFGQCVPRVFEHYPVEIWL